MAGVRASDPGPHGDGAHSPTQLLRGVPLPTVNQLGKVLTNHRDTASHKLLCQSQCPEFSIRNMVAVGFLQLSCVPVSGD